MTPTKTCDFSNRQSSISLVGTSSTSSPIAKTPGAFACDADGNPTSDGRWTNRRDAAKRSGSQTGKENLSPPQVRFQHKILIGLGLLLASILAVPAQSTNRAALRFHYERFDAQGGALSRSRGGHDDFVEVVFLDSRDRVWVGTMTGLAVYDGKQWTNRTFKGKGDFFAILGTSEDGIQHIAEGPPGTIWLDDFCRVRDNKFEEIAPKTFETILGTAVDHDGSLWVVTKTQVRKYDGKSWTTVLSPYAKRLSYKTGGLHGIAIESNGHVWIGGRVHGELKGPWEHEGAAWIVNRKRLDEGPPAAALFEFDGKSWKAFGPQQGMPLLDEGWAFPEVDGEGRLIVETCQRYGNRAYRVRQGESWTPTLRKDFFMGRQWDVRRTSGIELRFRDREGVTKVQPTDHQTGAALPLELGRWQISENCWAEDRARGCLWLGAYDGLYRIWVEPAP